MISKRTILMSIRRVVSNLKSDNPQQHRDYFVDLLGFEVAMDLGWIITLVSPDNPAAQISILAEDPSGFYPELSIAVDNVDEVYAQAVAQQLEIVYPITDEPWGVRRFFTREPGGRIINIVSHA
jgi:catechol 2,3-dioxygenase-like lactoylglutathione lyase family enzyme